MRFILALTLAAFGLSGAALAQDSDPAPFNLFALDGAYANRIFLFDEVYAEDHDVEVPVPFSVSVPAQDPVEVIADGEPGGNGLAKFTFAVGDPRAFLESVLIVPTPLPMAADDAQDPVRARVETASAVLRDVIFPQVSQGLAGAEMLALEAYPFEGYMGAHLIARYTDAELGPMLLRLTAHPNPVGAQSYVAISAINLSMVPVTNGETLLQSMSTRVANSLTYRASQP
ncbi:hypothetical protein [Nioella nitratireducens]|uniref:hypothetical protein n=1 Tax=Nioella nitratireducens TaxID=1287720 RepID=UPI0008FD7085|nr:hypothetical protein [Nioella nitratireducens]